MSQKVWTAASSFYLPRSGTSFRRKSWRCRSARHAACSGFSFPGPPRWNPDKQGQNSAAAASARVRRADEGRSLYRRVAPRGALGCRPLERIQLRSDGGGYRGKRWMSSNCKYGGKIHGIQPYPVLFQETIDSLQIRPDGVYVDGTAGGGGHSQAILDKLTTGTLLSIDQDPDAVAVVTRRLPEIHVPSCGRQIFPRWPVWRGKPESIGWMVFCWISVFPRISWTRRREGFPITATHRLTCA